MATYTKTVDPNGGANYPSLNAWEAGEQTLYSSGDIAVADCKRTGATKDTTAVTVAGWTAGVIPKIIVNVAYRHEGKWANQRGGGNYVYILEVNGSGIQTSMPSTDVDGLLIDKAGTADYGIGVYFNTGSAGSIFRNGIIRRGGTAATQSTGILSASNSIVYNAIVYGFSGGSGHKGVAPSSGQLQCLNVTVFDCYHGFYQSWQNLKCINTAALNCNVCHNLAIGGYVSGTNYNVSSDVTAVGANKATGKTAYADYFVDPANGDFHLKGSSSTLWGLAGTDLSGTFTTDIDGQTRTAWDIGADEYIAAGGTQVDSDFAALFDIRGQINSDFETAFDIRQTVNSDFQTVYQILTEVSTDFQTKYDILNAVSSDFACVYDVRQTAESDLEVVFDIRRLTDSDLQILYDMGGQVSSDFEVIFDLGKNQVRVRSRRGLRLGLSL